MAEYTTDAQKNYGWGLTLNMTGKAPAVSKRIFKALANAQEYVNNANESAIAGLRLSVISDENVRNNGVYFVKSIGTADGTAGVLEKIGGQPALVAESYDEAKGLATANNVGQIITVTGGDKKGIYVVTGAGTLDGLGTSSVSDQLAERVTTLEGDVTTLKGDENTSGSVKKAVKDGDDAVKTELEKKIEKVEAAHTSVSKKEDGHVRVSTDTDATTGKQTVTIAESDIASEKDLDALTETVGKKATTGETATEATGLFKYVDEKVAGVPKYKVAKNESTGGFYLTADGNKITDSVEIGFKDYVVRSGKVVKGTWNTERTKFEESTGGTDTAIKLVLNVREEKTGTDGEETIYIDAASLVDTYTVAKDSSSYISINDYVVTLSQETMTAIDDVPTIKSDLSKLNKDTLKTITVNGHTLNTGTTSADIVTKEIKTGEAIKLNDSDENPIVESGKTIDDVIKGIYTQINSLNGSKVESVKAADKSGVNVDNTDAKNPKISLEFETPSETTIGNGHLAIKVNDKGQLYAEMYYLTDDAES